MVAVGWIGVGVMGRHMCNHLMAKGHTAAVYSRTAAKCAPLVANGARLCATPREAAQGADVVFTMVGAPDDVEAVTLGAGGCLEGLGSGALLVDMTTSTPSLAHHIAVKAKEKGVLAMDAPVSGGDVGAAAATLSIMCGGSEEAMEKAKPLLDHMGTTIAHMGGPGAGQHTKMCNQACAAHASPLSLPLPSLPLTASLLSRGPSRFSPAPTCSVSPSLSPTPRPRGSTPTLWPKPSVPVLQDRGQWSTLVHGWWDATLRLVS